MITAAIRDEGTSYHYLPADVPAVLSDQLFGSLNRHSDDMICPYFTGTSWTTDAPYRETQMTIEFMKKQHVTSVEMEAAALYALATAQNYAIICFAHLTNSMAQKEGDFEKGEEFGSIDTIRLASYVLNVLNKKVVY